LNYTAKLVASTGLTRAHALGAAPNAFGVPVGLLAFRTRIAGLRGESPELLRGRGAGIGRRDRIRTCTGFRPRVSETRVYTLHHSPEELVRPGRGAWRNGAPGGAGQGPERSESIARPRAKRRSGFLERLVYCSTHSRMIGRGGRSRTGTGNGAQRVLSPPFFLTSPRREEWCGQRESHPHELALTGFSLRRVYCFATSAKTGASTGTCALLSVLPRQSVAFYGLVAKWSKRKDSHLRSPSGRRVYSAPHLLLCHASKINGGSSGIRTRGLLLMRELRSLLRHRAKVAVCATASRRETGGTPR
jgi:hypothetical protein